MSFPRYPAYKDSGVEWLGEVPEHWNSKRMKFLFNLVKRDVKSTDRIVTCFRDGVVTLRENRRTEGFTNALKEIGYQGIRVGDLIIHAMDAFAGAIGVSDSNGKSSPVYSVCVPVSKSISADYYARLLRHMALSGFVTSLAKGIRERSTDFRWSDAGEIFLPVPSFEEQTKIAHFLDHETARIDALIAEQERLIELLKEKRQAVISHAVTKGLDPTAPLKDSGVEWLGQVPAHWTIKKIGYVAEVTKLTGFEYTNYWHTTDQGEIIALRGFNIGERTLNLENIERINIELSKKLERSSLNKGDIVLPCTGTLGNAALIPGDNAFHINQNIAKLRLSSEIRPDFAVYWLTSSVFRRIIDFNNTSSMQPVLLISDIRNIRVPIPPLSEQVKLAKNLDEVVEQYDDMLCSCTQSCDLLQERRSALISAAVTGKIDVRGWQPAASAAPAAPLEAARG